MIQNPTLIVLSSVLLNGDNSSAKKLLIWRKVDKVRGAYFFSNHHRDLFIFIINLDLIFVEIKLYCRRTSTVYIRLQATTVNIQSTVY